MCYSELLADVFMKTHHRRGRPIIITDGSDRAEVYLDRLAYQLKNGQLGMRGVVAVTAVTRGFAEISLREASAHWPDVIILRPLAPTMRSLPPSRGGHAATHWR